MSEITTGVFTPSDKDLGHIEEGLFVIEIQGKPTYHRWRDVWDEQIKFKSKVRPHDTYPFRAVAMTVPTYHKYGVVNSVYPAAFIYGVRLKDESGKTGKTFMTRIDEQIEFL